MIKLAYMIEDGAMIGKKILVGLTYLSSDGEVSDQIQLHGLINTISENSLSFSRSDGEGDFSIPFDGDLGRAEEEAVYHLKSTGEEVSGVSYLASFTIHKPSE